MNKSIAQSDGDEYQGIMPIRLAPNILKELYVLRPAYSLMAIIANWIGINLSIWLSELYWNFPLYILVVFWIGTRQHALAILMHDAAHYRVTTNKKLNDIIGECFLAWPLTITLFGYRKTHAAHHRHLNTENDPDWTQDIQRAEFSFPKTLPQITWITIKYCLGFYAIKEMTNVSGYNERVPLQINLPRFLLYIAAVAASIYFNFWLELILYWIVPVMTSLLLLLYVRAVADHHAGLANDHLYNKTRTTIATWWESLLIAPHNVNFHIEHHMYPGVPFYNLPKLHAILSDIPAYRDNAHITHGLLKGLLSECQGHPRSALAGTHSAK